MPMPEMDWVGRFESGIIMIGNGAAIVVMVMLLVLVVGVVFLTGQFLTMGVNVIATGVDVEDETRPRNSNAGREQYRNQRHQVRQLSAPRLHLMRL